MFGDVTKEEIIFNLGKQPWGFNDQNFEVNLNKNSTSEHLDKIEFEFECEYNSESKISNLDQTFNRKPRYCIQFPTESPHLELKALPNHLKYAYLGKNEILHIVISSHLTKNQEENFPSMLRRHKEASGLTMADKGLSPSIIQHHIHLTKEMKPERDPQRKLNLTMQEVFMLKL